MERKEVENDESAKNLLAGVTSYKLRSQPTMQTRHLSPMWRSRWSQGWGPRGTHASKARTGHSAGFAWHRRSAAYGRLHVRFAVNYSR